jgi:phosphoribosylcarboxyaminoimidazole (NCAIR) mutase
MRDIGSRVGGRRRHGGQKQVKGGCADPTRTPIVTAFLQTPQLTTTTTRMASLHGLLGARPKSAIVDQGLVADVLGVLASIAEAVPVLGAPVKGSLEALKQIVQYSQVCSERTGAPVEKLCV